MFKISDYQYAKITLNHIQYKIMISLKRSMQSLWNVTVKSNWKVLAKW